MYRQDKATTERHTKILRELVKQPENKVCADCKRNDARWASWNIGAFICIRCSGIHRSMGTHISRVKSVDLDTWTPEQMDSIQRWGNHRVNLYWEAHLRSSHTPPEHKMESFIRSKYESRRWAREGPPPSDPSVLESNGNSAEQEVTTISSSSQARPVADIPAASVPPPVSSPTTRQPRPHQLLSAATVGRASPAQPAHAITPAPDSKVPSTQSPSQLPSDDLFTLDFHSPSPSLSTTTRAEQVPKKDVKSDILSLYSNSTSGTANNSVATTPVLQTSVDPFTLWGQQAKAQTPPVTSMVGQTGVGMWGVQSGCASPVSRTQSSQSDIWGTFSSSDTSNGTNVAQKTRSMNTLFETSNVWGGSTASVNASVNDPNGLFSAPLPLTAQAQKKDDVFGDLWGDFK